jgi:hypothetical protein
MDRRIRGGSQPFISYINSHIGNSGIGVSRGKETLCCGSSPVTKSRYAKPRISLSVNGFRRFGTRETQGQDPSSSPVAKSRYTKPRISLSVNGFRQFRHPGNPRARPLVFASREIPVCETPNQFSVNGFRRFGTRETKGQDPSFSQVVKSRYAKPRRALWMSPRSPGQGLVVGRRSPERIWTVHL